MPSNLLPFRRTRPRVAEFFAGVGLARMGLGRAGFDVAWANDLEPFKRDLYVNHFRDEDHQHQFVLGDVAAVKGDDLPDVDLAWSSFPCTDLSLAGNRAGLVGKHSSTFYQFTRILEEMADRRPRVVALENVTALANSHGGEDLAAAVRELNRLGYSVDVLALDARRFVPQSRPRLFLVGAMDAPADEHDPNSELRPDWLQGVFGDPTLTTHRGALPSPPSPLTEGLGDYIERMATDDERWWPANRVDAFLSSMSEAQTARLDTLKPGRVSYRTAYRRTRGGIPVWEIRADDVSGCLRTARGGSSKQAVVKVGNGSVQIRWMTPLEYARLMGAGDYRIEGFRDSHVMFGFGDAVCVDAVAWLSENYLMPLLNGTLGVNDTEKKAYGESGSRVV